MHSRRALFLDRDGVINVDRNYVYRREEFVWCDGIFELGREACARGYALVVVTNQSGIGRGYYTEAAFTELTQWMCEEMSRLGAPIARIYHCAHHPEAVLPQYRSDHPWRKPAPGMILQAGEDLGLDLARSILIGDRPSDIAAAKRAGISTTVLVGTLDRAHAMEAEPTAVVPTVRSAVAWFLRHADTSIGAPEA